MVFLEFLDVWYNLLFIYIFIGQVNVCIYGMGSFILSRVYVVLRLCFMKMLKRKISIRCWFKKKKKVIKNLNKVSFVGSNEW